MEVDTWENLLQQQQKRGATGLFKKDTCMYMLYLEQITDRALLFLST